MEFFKVIDFIGELFEVSVDFDFKNGEVCVIWENGFLKYNFDCVVFELLDGLCEVFLKMNF